MRRVFSAAEYAGALADLSPEERRLAAQALAEAAEGEAARRALPRVVLLYADDLLQELAAMAAELIEYSGLQTRIARLSEELPDLCSAVVCDLLFSRENSVALMSRKQRWITAVQEANCPVITIGIPAGVDPDTGKAGEGALTSTITIAPAGYVQGMFLRDGLDHCGQIRCLGQPSAGGESILRFETEDAVRFLPPRKRTAHKGDSGKALLCVGSPKYVGAALLSARACLAAGCGILFVACPAQPREALNGLPEAIGISVGEDWSQGSCAMAVDALAGKQAVGIGCGVGEGEISPLLEAALRRKVPTVLDADGLNCLSRHPELFGLLHEKVVLTPHPGEMARLLGASPGELLSDQVQTAKGFAQRWGCVVLLKGAATVVSDGRRTRIVAEGNAGLGKGGSGDVLTGIITGLLAQGVETFDGACLGSYLLGTSADRAFELLRERMLRASNVIEALERT